MTPRELATIALRVMGLVYLLDAVQGLVGWLALSTIEMDSTLGAVNYDPMIMQAANLISIAVLAAFGLACLINTRTLVRWLFADLPAVPAAAPVRGLETLGFALVGVFIAAWSAVGVLSAAVTVLWYLGAERRDGLPEVVSQSGASWLYAVAGVVIGLAVFQAARWLGRRTRLDKEHKETAMSDESKRSGGMGEQRSGTDRRSGKDRRQRNIVVPPEQERRKGKDRRSGKDRRRG